MDLLALWRRAMHFFRKPVCKSLALGVLSMLVAEIPVLAAPPVPGAAHPAVAFYYGESPPWDQLQAFDIVIVDPDHVPYPQIPALAQTRLAAYVALGEVQPTRDYAKHLPNAWLRGQNKDWASALIDQAQPDWPHFFVNTIITPLWEKGYRTFFLDTLDSYQLFAKTPEERMVQEAGMVAVIKSVKQRYPEARLIFNRGFEILDRTHAYVEAVVAESLFERYEVSKASYSSVPDADRQWLLNQLQRVRDVYHLPVVVIDYVASSQRDLARRTAQRITDLGFTPWVATPDLASLGVGSIEVLPRKVLVVHSPVQDEYALRKMGPVRFASMPLHYLGYVPEYVDARHLPDRSLAGRYAGVIVWLTEEPGPIERRNLLAWTRKQVDDNIALLMMNQFDYLIDSALGKSLGLNAAFPARTTDPIETIKQSDMIGFERMPRPGPENFFSLTLAQGSPLLTLRRGQVDQVVAALTPWGGYVIGNYGVINLPGDNGDRWVVNPFTLFQAALRLPEMPIADVSTESGRRMLMVHMDGDGFVSRSELPGHPMAGEVVRDRVVKKYPLPMTISVIEAELAPAGLYPGLSPSAEQVARDIFRAPHVAIASHSYSHPFIWRQATSGDANEGYNLRIPGYKFDLQREIIGSIRYIEERLAPPGKKVEMFFWTGDCIPGSDALGLTKQAGVLNMNGGDTVTTRSQASVTRIEGLGLQRQAGFQVFAPHQNENVYTNNWQGPFYGFERVIETFELTESPRRLKPIDIYFHTYLTTRRAGMQSLDKVFAYALAQETTPVFVSEYARKVLDFQTLAIARTAQGWRVRGAKDLRTLRIPKTMGFPDLDKSLAIAGYHTEAGHSYVHLAGDDALLVLQQTPSAKPRLVSVNASIVNATPTETGMRWQLAGHVPLQFSLAHAGNCQVRSDGAYLKPVRRKADFSYYQLKTHAARSLETICRH